jgi:hypothetical protein
MPLRSSSTRGALPAVRARPVEEVPHRVAEQVSATASGSRVSRLPTRLSVASVAAP